MASDKVPSGRRESVDATSKHGLKGDIEIEDEACTLRRISEGKKILRRTQDAGERIGKVERRNEPTISAEVAKKLATELDKLNNWEREDDKISAELETAFETANYVRERTRN